MGKSRLVAEFVRIARRRGLFVAFGECQSFGDELELLRLARDLAALFGPRGRRARERSRAAGRAELEAIDPALVARCRCSSSLLGLEIAGHRAHRSFDAKLRKASLEDLFSIVLRARSADQPIILVLEDCHWIDPLSRDLLEVLGRAAPPARPHRPRLSAGARDRRRPGIERTPGFTEIVPRRAVERRRGRRSSDSKLEQVARATPARHRGRQRLVRRARPPRTASGRQPVLHRGADQLHREHGVDPADAEVAPYARAAGEPPQPRPVADRRDGRSAPPDAQGRERRRPACSRRRSCRARTRSSAPSTRSSSTWTTLRAADLVNLDRDAEQAYLFKHVATQEVAYESLPFALRTMLHGRVGRWLESADPDGDRPHASTCSPTTSG